MAERRLKRALFGESDDSDDCECYEVPKVDLLVASTLPKKSRFLLRYEEQVLERDRKLLAQVAQCSPWFVEQCEEDIRRCVCPGRTRSRLSSAR